MKLMKKLKTTLRLITASTKKGRKKKNDELIEAVKEIEEIYKQH